MALLLVYLILCWHAIWFVIKEMLCHWYLAWLTLYLNFKCSPWCIRWKCANLYHSSLCSLYMDSEADLFCCKTENGLGFCQMESVCDCKIGLLPAMKIGLWKSDYILLDWIGHDIIISYPIIWNGKGSLEILFCNTIWTSFVWDFMHIMGFTSSILTVKYISCCFWL